MQLQHLVEEVLATSKRCMEEQRSVLMLMNQRLQHLEEQVRQERASRSAMDLERDREMERRRENERDKKWKTDLGRELEKWRAQVADDLQRGTGTVPGNRNAAEGVLAATYTNTDPTSSADTSNNNNSWFILAAVAVGFLLLLLLIGLSAAIVSMRLRREK